MLAGPSEEVLKIAELALARPDPRTGGTQFVIDCRRTSSLPNLYITLGGTNFPLTPQEYILRVGNQCYFPFMPMDVPPPRGPLWVLGNTFMKKYYCIFDAGKKRMRMAPA